MLRRAFASRRWWLVALAVAVVATVAWQFKSAAPTPVTFRPYANSATAALSRIASNSLDPELVRLYSLCPEAAVVSLDEVVHAPDKVNALVPPVQLTAVEVPNTNPGSRTTRLAVSSRAAVPHIQYPNPVRIASRPAPPAAVASDTAGDWLVDPKEWFDDHDKPQSKSNNSSRATPANQGDAPPDATNESPAAPPEDTASPSEPPAETPATPPIAPTIAAPPLPPTIEAPPTSPTPLFTPPPAADSTAPTSIQSGAVPPDKKALGTVDPHLELFAKSAYPSARECAKCHEDIYEQWSISSHAYANVSPMFHKFEQKLNDLSQGTVGYFCMRCHAPVATAMCVSRDEPIWNLPEVGLEGVTCLACHRVQYMYGKSNGERRIEPGPIFAPVLGGIAGDGVADAIAHKDQFKVKTSPDEKGPGQDIHVTGICFEQLTRSEFCASCHQVAVQPGIKLEVVYEQYRASPACKKGIQCQDCHMGRVPGLPAGYECGPVAKIAGKTVNDNRKQSNHIFYGPNYPIAHPGVFPFNLKANRWSMQDWLAFDWRAGWGTDAFEEQIADGKLAANFPPAWKEADDRRDAREIIEANLKKLDHKREIREQIMENGSRVDGPFFDTQPCRGQELKLHVVITNTNEGHNLLTASLGAQPQLWANVVLIGPDGRRLWETGYTDSYGDLANIHSEDVRHGNLKFDWQLFNLQTMFLITGAKGTDREFFVPVNLDIDQIPFIRPGTQPITTLNHPPFIRMESQSLAPCGSRNIPFKIPGELFAQPGTYRLSFRLRNRAEPMYLMRFCEATLDMQRSMNEWMIDLHPISVEFVVP
jgi:cytochrome c554/c'-like protein